ncbi:MAG: helix-turn-helix transcriptional regulator [Asticcacaulis sp.]|uniref:helix-turn-helix domain-containing protein n=1 Tax=Asticcacaulis sp. TaxID=1872648 RepID=UPI0039E27EB9
MSTTEPNIIEDEPYQGIYRGEANSAFKGTTDGRLPDRFDLAEILKTTRESQGLSLNEVSELTRVRRAYLEAFEQAAYDILPPRAFAIGYVKAYAKALGLDEETLADMYKREVSPASTKLHAPSGASLEEVRPTYRNYIIAAVVLVSAVVIWNVVQRQPSLHLGDHNHEAEFGSSKWAAGMPNMLNGAIFVSQPQPAPRDQDVPVPYVTPGLEAGFASIDAAKNSTSAAPVPVEDMRMRKAFNPRGAIYGAAPENSSVTLQATKTVNLVVRDPATGAVYFAHSIGAGESYRLPANDQQNLLVDISDISAFEIYYNGEYAGTLDGTLTPVGRLNARAAQLSAALDQKQAQAAGQAVVPRATPAAPIAAPAADKPNGPIPYLPSQRPAAVPAENAVASSAQ